MIFSRKQRFRRIAKWIGFCACLLILAAWVMSLWSDSHIAMSERWFLGCADGLLVVAVFEPTYLSRPPSPHFETHEWRGFPFEAPELLYSPAGTNLQVPFWLLFLVAAPPTALLFYLDRRKLAPGLCTSCEYDLRGIESGICPECGKANAGSQALAVSREKNAKVEEPVIR